MKPVCIVLEDELQKISAMRLSKELNIPLFDTMSVNVSTHAYEQTSTHANANKDAFPYQLKFTEKGLVLLAAQSEGKSCLFVDFLKGPMGYRRKHGGGYKEALARAVGLKPAMRKATPKLTVLDATAGLGRDAFILADLGAKLHLVERSPIIAALLLDGLERAMQENSEMACHLKENISVTMGDARDVLNAILEGKSEKPDVIYLDPMFPEEKKTALVTIELRMIRDIVGADPDAEGLFTMALKTARKRVVVKRPIHAVGISDVKPSFVLKGKRNRYDVYILFEEEAKN